ncbi:MAG: VOC family protein [Alphaproteobacteria bacterium]|nr:VOC family protein [Alphaproteobacteria bacterium]
MPQKITTFLMFNGQAEGAMSFYLSLFRGAHVVSIERYGPQGPGTEGSVMKAEFSLGGQSFYCIDSNTEHAFGFTPAMSLFVHCESESEIEYLFRKLSDGGQVLMPLGDYGFSVRFGWVADRYGVSWQLNLPRA